MARSAWVVAGDGGPGDRRDAAVDGVGGSWRDGL
jgi:hypothetical protein